MRIEKGKERIWKWKACLQKKKFPKKISVLKLLYLVSVAVVFYYYHYAFYLLCPLSLSFYFLIDYSLFASFFSLLDRTDCSVFFLFLLVLSMFASMLFLCLNLGGVILKGKVILYYDMLVSVLNPLEPFFIPSEV
jgi:hypothetical protein